MLQRHGIDNAVIVQEIFHTMRNKKGKNGFVGVKVDLEKAYDRIQWQLAIDTLKTMGFNDHFCNLITSCLSNITM